jgi:hypothetical protein
VLTLPAAILRLASDAAGLAHRKSRAGWGKSAGLIISPARRPFDSVIKVWKRSYHGRTSSAVIVDE